MVDNSLFDSFIFDNRVTESHYHNLKLKELKELEYIPLNIRRKIYYKHDGTEAHFAGQDREHLNERFPVLGFVAVVLPVDL